MLPPAGVKFNLVMFGSSHQMMWPQAREVTEGHTGEAEAWVQANVNARWGGTEILGALKAVFGVPVSKGETRRLQLRMQTLVRLPTCACH